WAQTGRITGELVRVLSHSSPVVRVAAIDALAELGELAAREYLAPRLAIETDEKVIEQLATQLLKYPSTVTPATLDKLLNAVKSEETQLALFNLGVLVDTKPMADRLYRQLQAEELGLPQAISMLRMLGTPKTQVAIPTLAKIALSLTIPVDLRREALSA